MRTEMFILLAIFLTTQICSSSLIDNSYQRYCRTNIHGDQNCYFTVAYWFNFVNFRQWLEKLPDPLGDVSLNIYCFDGAHIYMPFPFRARNLKKLHVKNCLIRSFMSEWNSTSQYPDTIEEQEIENSEFEVDYQTMQEVISSTLNKKNDCGQKTLIKLALKNNTYKPVVKDPNVSLKSLADSFEAFQDRMKSADYLCSYKNLDYLERSGESPLSKTYMKTLTDKSHYPRLKTIRMMSNQIVNFPEQFKRWWEYFPTLRQLDLSNNSLQNFSFNIPMKTMTNLVPLFVNLRQNNIKSVPSDIGKYLSQSPIILDVRENPIECDCNAEKLGHYLRAVRRRYPLYKHFTEVVCKSPRQVKNIKLIYINYEKCSQTAQI
ncbi:uncharacterized protein LOC133204998 [Saccostrea echinata]|uniref:uncharacterized protein LOC133204998 n=1 Tax=Saccostrea echinata TaxID=191078 RepID=UPI002A7F3649|nr:uncharacterized protein LOC133204998 [Saccostrea echinata]